MLDVAPHVEEVLRGLDEAFTEERSRLEAQVGKADAISTADL